MKKRSLILVTVDCLRADHVGFLGYSRPVTPFLDSLAPQSTIFSDAIVAGAPTYFSFPGIMASRHALALGRDILGIAPGEATIATELHKAGYKTAAFVAGNPYLSARFGYDQGFDNFQDYLGASLDTVFTPDHPSGSKLNRMLHSVSRKTRFTAAAYDKLYFHYGLWRSTRQNLSLDQLRRYPAADVIVDHASTWLNSVGSDSFFLWIHLMDPHHPYYPPQEAISALGATDIDAQRARQLNANWNRGDVGPASLERHRSQILTLYDAGIYWADKQIARLAETLKGFQLWDDSVFVVTADHGEGFLEHGARYHSPENLPEQLIHVPLLIHSRGEQPRTIASTFSQIHLAPTLLQSLQVPVPETFQGQSHWTAIASGAPINDVSVVECLDACNNPFHIEDRMRSRLLAVRDSEYKLVIHFGEKREELYDLKHDPQELSPLRADAMKDVRHRLWQVARIHLQQSRQGRESLIAFGARIRQFQQSVQPSHPSSPESAP